MAWTGTCSECLVTVVYAATVEMQDHDAALVRQGPDFWENGPWCAVCGGTVDWIGNDPTSSILVKEAAA